MKYLKMMWSAINMAVIGVLFFVTACSFKLEMMMGMYYEPDRYPQETLVNLHIISIIGIFLSLLFFMGGLYIDVQNKKSNKRTEQNSKGVSV